MLTNRRLMNGTGGGVGGDGVNQLGSLTRLKIFHELVYERVSLGSHERFT
jgi:hypothetical protein